jgi:CRP-like cAMP-binding protein
MIANGPLPNRLLRMLDAADFALLRPHLIRSELVRETVLGEAGTALRHVYFPHAGTVSITVGMSEGQTIEVAMLGRDSIVGGGAACSSLGPRPCSKSRVSATIAGCMPVCAPRVSGDLGCCEQ